MRATYGMHGKRAKCKFPGCTCIGMKVTYERQGGMCGVHKPEPSMMQYMEVADHGQPDNETEAYYETLMAQEEA